MKHSYRLLCLITFVLLSACSGSNPDSKASPTTAEETFTLRLVADPKDGGYVLPAEGEYIANSKVILNAMPSSGYVFDNWSGDVSGAGSSLEIIMDSNKVGIANFSKGSTATPRPTATPKPTSTPRPTPTATPEPCRKPAGITADDTGQLIEVCGEVTNWGSVPCPNCPLGGYSFLKLDSAFLIISYNWAFNNNWIGNCIIVADTVEMLGTSPVFIFGSGEGYSGSDCTSKSDGSLSCSQGDYFMQYSGCGSE